MGAPLPSHLATWGNSISLDNHGTSPPRRYAPWLAIVLPPYVLKVLEGFHMKATHRMAGMRLQRHTVSPCVYPKSAHVLANVHRKPVATYIHRHRHDIS